MPFGFHGIDLIVILVVALLIFGPKRLPEMGNAIGKSISSFKHGMSELTSPKDEKPEDYEAIHEEVTTHRSSATTPEFVEEPATSQVVHDEPATSEVVHEETVHKTETQVK